MFLNVFYVFIASSYFSIAFSSNNTGTSSSLYPISNCEDDFPINVDILNYELKVDDSNANNICPKSDPKFPQWSTQFQDSNGTPVSGSYFIRSNEGPLDPSVACNKDGKLIIETKPNYQNNAGLLHFMFTSDNGSYSTNFTIRYAKIGVYADESTVYFREGAKFAVLNWYIYQSEVKTDKLYYNNQIIEDQDMNISLNSSKYGPFDHKDTCKMSSTGDTTTLYSLFVFNPTAATSTGEYVLEMGEHSATITLAVNPYPPTTTTSSSIPTSSFTSSVSSTHNLDPSTTASPIIDPPSSATQDNHRPIPYPTSDSRPHTSSTSDGNRFIITVPTNKDSSTGTRNGVQIILPVVLVLFMLVVVCVIVFVFIYFKLKRKNQQDPEKQQQKGQHRSSSSFIQRQFSEDPSLYKYHLPSVTARNDVIQDDHIELDNFNSPSDDRPTPQDTNTTFLTSSHGASRGLSRSLSAGSATRSTTPKSNIGINVVAIVTQSSVPVDSMHSNSTNGDGSMLPGNVSRSMSVDSDKERTTTSHKPIPQHKWATHLRGNSDTVSRSLPTTAELLIPHETSSSALLSASYSSLAQEKEKSRLLKQFLKQAKRKLDPKMSTEVIESGEDQVGTRNEITTSLKQYFSGKGSNPIGYSNQLSMEDDADMFQLELEHPSDGNTITIKNETTDDCCSVESGNELKN